MKSSAILILILGLAALPLRAEDLPALNTPPTPDSFPGKFVWANLFTADPSAAEAFYTGLFGWSAATVERTTASGTHPYIVLSVEGRPIAGIARRPPLLADEVHGRWVGYVSVPDVAQALSAGTAAGGRVLFPAVDLPQRGTQAVLADPEGALIGLLHSSSGDPGEFEPDPGDWTWAELFSRSPENAASFYRAVAGYAVQPDNRNGLPNAYVLVSGGYSRASVAPVPDRPRARPVWLLFVRVADVRAAAAKAVALGGKVLVPPGDAETEYWRAIVADPAGAPIGLVQLEEPAAAPQKP
jgi:predicted enzyme related to lactoylglutathione lyase